MRIRRLDLLRYGRFTGRSLDLPEGKPDIHILFGPNEAGKSTTLSAIEQALFGIPKVSPLNFLHDYKSMRVGAVVESDGLALEFRRRKGHKDTLLGPDDAPLSEGDAALAPYLGGADLQFFTRMFSLDYERLRQGGREILEARDEAGQTLFSAGAGLSGLRECLNALDEEADSLWGARRAGRRKYTQAEDLFKEADAALRGRIVTASQWQELRRAHESACEAYEAIELEIQRRTVEQRRLSRIRRVYRNVCRMSELDAQIAALGEAPLLPENAGQALEAAERAEADASARIETLAGRLAAEREARAALACDETLLRCADDIRSLHERRIRLQAGRAELPRLQAELESAEAAFRRFASEFNWEASDLDGLIARMPPRAKTASLRTLLNRRGQASAVLEGAQAALEEAEARGAGLARQLDSVGPSVDVSMLAAVVASCRHGGDIVSRISTADAEAQEAEAAANRRLAALKPAVSSGEVLAAMPVPARDAVQRLRDARREVDQRLAANRDRLSAARSDLSARRKDRERLQSDGKAVSAEELAQSRAHRDESWPALRRALIEGDATPESQVASYETGVRRSDALADRRFDFAEAAGRLAAVSARIAETEDLVEAVEQEERRLTEEAAALDLAWENTWSEAGVKPSAPDAMLEWLTARAEVLAFCERRLEARRRAGSFRAEEARMMEELLAALRAVEQGAATADRLKGQPLRVSVERAADFVRVCEQSAANRRRLEESLSEASAEVEAKRKALHKAGREWSDWGEKWIAALAACGLDGAVAVESAAAQLDALDEMRQLAGSISELSSKRIVSIQSEETAFRAEAARLFAAVAPDLSEGDADISALELERRLAEAERSRDLMKEKDEAVAALDRLVQDVEISRRQAHHVIGALQEQAGADSVEALRSAVVRSGRCRELTAALASVNAALIEDGDGLPLTDLREACRDADLDRIAAREETLEGELADLRAQLMEAQQRRVQARREFEAIGGADAAAQAASVRQAALAELAGTAAQYIRARTAGLLLRWAIDRYRREKQAPILRRAGECFATLTNGSFAGLQLEFDEDDKAHLAGVRPDGARVGVSGMSTGTADQLYLALRLASVEDYLERARPLPFVADDLFINFDDERSAAGLEALAQLARRTQVLVFTHHARLVEIARVRLGAEVSVVTL